MIADRSLIQYMQDDAYALLIQCFIRNSERSGYILNSEVYDAISDILVKDLVFIAINKENGLTIEVPFCCLYPYEGEVVDICLDRNACKGVIVGTDIYRIHGKIETIEYDILVEDYETYRKKCLYKHIDEKHIKATPGKLLIISGFSGVGKGTVIQQLLTEYPEKYVVSVSATTRKPRKGEVDGKSYYFKKREEFEDLINKNEFLEFAEYAGEYYGTLKKDVYKNYFKGKNVIIEIDSQGARQIREKQKIQSVFLIPPSFEELLHRLKNRGTESKESIHRRLKQALDEIEHIEEYGVLLVNDSVEGTAFVIDALFHLGLKNASGMNERELKIAREIREGIIKYLSDEEDE